jgi:hypothetical protein
LFSNIDIIFIKEITSLIAGLQSSIFVVVDNLWREKLDSSRTGYNPPSSTTFQPEANELEGKVAVLI